MGEASGEVVAVASSVVTPGVGDTEGMGMGTVVTATGGTDGVGVGVGVGLDSDLFRLRLGLGYGLGRLLLSSLTAGGERTNKRADKQKNTCNS